MPSREILKIRDGTPLEAEEILTYIKKLSKRIEPSREILKIRDGTPLEMPSREILKIRDGTPLEKKRVARILFSKIRPSREIFKIRDGTPLEAEEILTYIKKLSKRISYFYSKLDIPSNVVQKKRVARILFSKIRPSREILKIRDGTPLEAEEILTYIKKLSKRIEPSREILKIRDGTPLEAEEILTYIKKLSKRIEPSREILKIRDVHKKRVARILFSKIRPSREILKIRDGTPLEAEEILTYIKKLSKRISYFYSKLDIPSNVVQKKRVARILFSKIRPSREILKIRDGTPLETEEILTYIKKLSKRIEMARILFSKIRPSREILKIRDGTPLEAEEILTYIKKLSKRIGLPSREILKIRDGTPLEAEKILTYIKKLSKRIEILKIRDVHKKRVARILFSKIRPSREILKIRDGTPLEAEEILTYIKKLSKRISYFYSKLDIPSNVVQKKRVARILFSKIRPSREILKIRDGTPLETEEILTYIKKLSKRIVARILFSKIRPSREILKIRDGTPLEAEEILTYIKKLSKRISYFYSKLDIPSNVVQKKRVARILFSKIRPSREILKIRDGTPLETEEILTYIKKLSKRIGLLLL
ncbi:hypothetical protein OROMI_001754 [Orobanche minor]